MNPIDYWYKKYIALKECKLTWEDMMTIDVFLHNVSDEKCTTSTIDYYKEVLRRFNELKEKHNGM